MPRPNQDDSTMIGFTSKELFLEINRKIDLLTNVTNLKADRAEHEKLTDLVDDIRRLGSDRSREALAEISELREKHNIELDEVRSALTKLEKESASANSVKVTEMRLNEADRSTKMQWIAIYATMVIGILNIVALVLTAHPAH